jgi:hypothetical protein
MRDEVVARVDSESVLLAVLASPPATTSGARTRHRLGLACYALGYERVEVVNLFSRATSNVLDIATLGVAEAAWKEGRPGIVAGLNLADAVLLGWGATEPIGAARQHHRAQVAWLRTELRERGLVGWTVGGTPRHPSRFTARHFPDLAFSDALPRALRRGDE